MENNRENLAEKVNVNGEVRYITAVLEELDKLMIRSKDAESLVNIKQALRAVIDSLNAKNPAIMELVEHITEPINANASAPASKTPVRPVKRVPETSSAE